MMRTFLLSTAFLIASVVPARAGVVIDNFNAVNGGVQATGPIGSGTDSSTQGGFSSSDVIGGERTIDLAINSNGGDPSLFQARAIDDGSTLSTNNDTGVNSTTTVVYDGPGSAGLGGVDLTVGGGFAFSFNVLAADLGVTLTVTVTDTSNNTVTATTGALAAGPQAASLLFAGFAGVDFTSVDKIVLRIDGPDAVDLQIGQFDVLTSTAVPEPSTFATAGIAGAIGLVALRKRRRSA